jgi:chemosensory pili system protein ChpA (sensor histidine kinase/response regulator)
MSPLLLALPLAAAGGLAAWRVAVVRRRAAAARAVREQATQAALKAARHGARRPRGAPAAQPAATRADLDLARATARARANRVIAAELARREAEFQKTRDAHEAADRRAAQAAAALMATMPMPHLPEVARAADAPPPLAQAFAETQPLPLDFMMSGRTPDAARVPKSAAQTLILAVDDSRMVRVKSSRLLAAHGFQVVTAVDGLDALRQMERCSPDLVITDVEMPEMDGFGLVNALRANPGTRDIPVVMITSAEDRHRDDARRAGVGLMMGKPYDEAALIAHIRSFAFFGERAAAGSPSWA